LEIQNGKAYTTSFTAAKYIHNARVLGAYVHRDAAFQAYYNAALILLGANAPLDSSNPYVDGTATKEEGFTTLGVANILTQVAAITDNALKTAWHQKWNVHQRLRPEAMACRVHFQDIGDTNYGLHADLMSSPTIAAIKAFNGSGTALLSLQYPEGSPTHPSYPAGHATVAGACATILKAFFDESTLITDLFTVEHSVNGDDLIAYSGSTTGMTVGTELNKLAANVSIGRDWAGVHYRADGDYGMDLGEKIAIAYLKDLKASYNETVSFNLTQFNGDSLVI
jgi:membrane-associated phospholipid phosphatase